MKQGCILIICLLHCPMMLSNTINIQLARLKKSANISLVETWDTVNLTRSSNGDYYRNDLIDEWDYYQPLKGFVHINDKFGRILAEFKFNTTGSSKNITSWMTSDRLISMKPHPKVTFDTYIRNGNLYLTQEGYQDFVYLATGKLNGTDSNQFIGFTKNGSSFPLYEGNLTEGQSIFWMKNYTNTSGISNVTIDLSDLDRSYFMNGISVFNPVNTSITYNFTYNNNNGATCNSSVQKNTTDAFTFSCDGIINIIPSIRVTCLWIYFAETIDTFDVALTESEKNFVTGKEIVVVGKYENDEASGTTSMVETSQVYTVSSNTCDCSCDGQIKTNKYEHLANKTTEELELLLKDEIEKIKKELLVDTNNLSSTLRRKTSASDTRPTAVGIGTAGVVILVLVIAFIMSTDMDHLYRGLKWLFFKIR